MASPFRAQARAITNPRKDGALSRAILLDQRSPLCLPTDCSTNSRLGRLDHVQERSRRITGVQPEYNGNTTEIEPNNNRPLRHLLQRSTPTIRTAHALLSNLSPNRFARMVGPDASWETHDPKPA